MVVTMLARTVSIAHEAVLFGIAREALERPVKRVRRIAAQVVQQSLIERAVLHVQSDLVDGRHDVRSSHGNDCSFSLQPLRS